MFLSDLMEGIVIKTGASFSFTIIRRLLTSIILSTLLLWGWGSADANAATQTGSLTSGQYQYFDITLPTPQTGLRLVLSSSASSNFALYTGTNHTAGTLIASSSAQTLHTLLVPAPSLSDGASYHVRILANANLTFSFTDDKTYVRDLAWDLGTSQNGTSIMNQPDSAGGDYLFKITTQTPVYQLWRTVLNVTGGEADLYLQQDTPPLGEGWYRSTNNGSDSITVSAGSYLNGQTWYIRVHATPGATWKLFSGDIFIQSLSWDNGSVSSGSSALNQPDTAPGDYFFKITAHTPANDAWRTVLNVTSGEADFYIQRDYIPTGDTTYKSVRTGSDGLILSGGQFSNNETWYIRVHASTSSTWNIFSGDIYVRDLGALSDSSSIPAVTIGPEGAYYFKTSVDSAVPAWRLWQNGANLPMYVRKAVAPVKSAWTELAEQRETGRMLLVPPYLTSAVYFVGVVGDPGTVFTFDSRSQRIRTGGADTFHFIISGDDDNGFGYVTYRIDVPIQQIAWQVNLTPGAANQNPELYIRQGAVPNRWMNSGLSEAPAGVVDSVTQVPPGLTDGAWYVTIYDAGSFTYTLSSGNPVITAKPFINTSDPNPVPPGYAYPYNTSPIVNDDVDRSGWRYYQVNNIDSQLGFLGWQLDLADQVPGSEIALRRNAVPARWRYRTGESVYSNNTVYESSIVDVSSAIGFLQRPGHPADIWYIGVYTADQALGAFRLTTREIPAPLEEFTQSSTTVSDQPAGSWKWYKFTVPADTNLLGWDLRLHVTSGTPQMVVRRDQLPLDFSNTSPSLLYYSSWPTGYQWIPSSDTLTGRTNGDKDSYLTVGMGNPLEAGTYYIGISGDIHDTTTALGYTLVSRGIGIGNDSQGVAWPLQVQDIGSFSGGSINGANLLPREVAWYKITVPTDAKSWSMRLEPTLGETAMIIRQGHLPNMIASTMNGATSDSPYNPSGTRRQKGGREFFYKYPTDGSTTITPGTYYIGVVSEGQNPPNSSTIGTGGVNYTLTSYGEMPISDKMATPVTEANPVDWAGETLQYGQQKVYRFRVPEGILSSGAMTNLEVRLKNRVGNPLMTLRQDTAGNGRISSPEQGYIASEGGWWKRWYDYNGLITIHEPAAGDYTLVADNTRPVTYPDASYDVEVVLVVQGATALPFTNGSQTVTGQDASTWRYFKVDVPTGPLGWDLRLHVTSGNPQMVIRRDQLPLDFSITYSSLLYYSSWPSGYQWLPSSDILTGRTDGDKDSYLTVGMGNPLEAGTYYIGISGDIHDTTTALGYTLVSRGIGIGNDSQGVAWPLQVQDIGSFSGGSINGANLLPREVAWYKITVPTDAKSWSMRLEPTLGETAMIIRQGHLPNMIASTMNGATSDSPYNPSGTRRQKGGREFFYKYPTDGSTTITPGTYYIGVISEGQNPPNSYTIGAGGVNYTLTSYGETPISDKTATPVTEANPISWTGETLQYGQQKVYRFRVPEGILSSGVRTKLEVRLKNRVGNPLMTLRQDTAGNGRIPSPGQSYTASEGGLWRNWDGYSLITIPEPASGDYTLVVDAMYTSDYPVTYPDASYDVEVTAKVPTILDINNGSANGHLLDQEYQYYQVIVPEQINGYPIAAWKIGVTTTNGTAQFSVAKGGLPGASNQETLTISTPYTVIAPPYLAPGNWYIGVKGGGITDYSITSEIISADPAKHQRTWVMPAKDGVFTQPGLQAPYFGDSGVDNLGNPIINSNTGDQGTDLAQDDWHFYRIVVPDNNGALLRTMLDAISGKPELYIRRGSAPSPYHADNDTYPNGTNHAYDRYQTLTGSQYGNWVPLDRRTETQLTPGDWWIGIRAVNSNIRYRLKLSAGNVRDANGPVDTAGYLQDMAMDGGVKTGQTLAAGDMRYYRVIIPQSSVTQSNSTPLNWTLNLQQQVGDVVIFVRDTIPPGFGKNGNAGNNYYGYNNYFQDWSCDNYSLSPLSSTIIDNVGPTTFSVPPVRPGTVYYLGVYAKTDATFDLSSSVDSQRLKIDGILPFTGGNIDTTMAAGETRLYRIDMPADALIWRQTARHDGGIRLYMSQGTVPYKDGAVHWSSNGAADSSLTQTLNGYPWQAGYSYYLLVENSTSGSLPFKLNTDGRTSLNELSVAITGNGNITSNSNIVTCASGTCTTQVVPFTYVTLYPNADTGYYFANWSGACAGQGWYCTLFMDGSTPVSTIANFARNSYYLYASIAGSGNGTITGNPAGISCPAVNCNAGYLYGDKVTLSALAAPGSAFTGWSGACSGIDSCSVSMDDTKFVTANFAKLFRLDVSITDTNGGGGSVTSNPPGIAVTNGTHNAGFADGGPVTLIPTPDINSIFAGWSGACTGSSGNCIIVMNSDKSVTANFSYVLPALIYRNSSTYYSLLQEAYNAAISGDTIKSRAFEFFENLKLNHPISIVLKGGYDNTYTLKNSRSILNGALTISKGKVTIENLVIR